MDKTVAIPELTDDEIVKVLHSLGIDTYPSKYGFPETQVSATNVPAIRKIVAAYLSAAPAATFHCATCQDTKIIESTDGGTFDCYACRNPENECQSCVNGKCVTGRCCVSLGLDAPASPAQGECDGEYKSWMTDHTINFIARRYCRCDEPDNYDLTRFDCIEDVHGFARDLEDHIRARAKRTYSAPAAIAQDTSTQSTDQQDVSKSGAEIDRLAAQHGTWEEYNWNPYVKAQQDERSAFEWKGLLEIAPNYKKKIVYGEYTVADYHRAVSGDGPKAYDWQDKPHRLVYDLLQAVVALDLEVDRLTAPQDAQDMTACANCLRPKCEHNGKLCPAPYTTHWNIWNYREPQPSYPEYTQPADSKQDAQERLDWIDVNKRPPERGQRIQGLSHSGAWIETFDPDEPLGNMTHWRVAPIDTNDATEAAPACQHAYTGRGESYSCIYCGMSKESSLIEVAMPLDTEEPEGTVKHHPCCDRKWPTLCNACIEEGKAEQSKCSDGGLCGAGGYCGECKAEQQVDAEDPPDGDNKIWNALAWMYRRMKPGYGRLPFVEEAMALSKSGKAEQQEGQVTVTDEMVTAYLAANTEYWWQQDELPSQNPSKWRNGTPKEATRISLEAALRAAHPPAQPQQSSEVNRHEKTDSHMEGVARDNEINLPAQGMAESGNASLLQCGNVAASSDGARMPKAEPQLSDEEILTLAKSFDGDLMPDCAPVLCGNEIVSFAHALLSRQSGDKKVGAA